MRTMLMLSAILFIQSIAFSDTIIVPDDYPTIQGAIDAAVDGDTVLVKPGTYAENIDFKGKAIHVQSEKGPDVTALDGGQVGTVVTFKSGEDGQSVLKGFTVTNGLADYGGGIFCSGSSPEICGNVIAGNTANYRGGGISSDKGSPLIVGNTLWGNIGRWSGGIFCDDFGATITGNILTENIAEDGAGIYCWNGPSIITGNTFSKNVAEDDGGGIHCDSCDQLVITDNSFSENSATSGGGIYCSWSSAVITGNVFYKNSGLMGGGIHCSFTKGSLIQGNSFTKNEADWGGGIYIYFCSPVVSGNKISDNEAKLGGGIHIRCKAGPLIACNIITNNTATAGDGGGIRCWDETFPRITGNLIRGNSAYHLGGGISVTTSLLPPITNNFIVGNTAGSGGGIGFSAVLRLTLVNNTITKNSASYGGGICGKYGTDATVTNTILWDNDAARGPEIYLGSTIVPSLIKIAHSDVDGGPPSVHLDPNCILTWGSGMIDQDPLFADSPEEDFHLLHPSPCRDSGDNVATGLPDEDFEGDPRIAEASTDMGADEFHPHLYYLGDATPGSLVVLKFIGKPGASPVGFWIAYNALETPVPGAYGDWWLVPPMMGPFDLGSIPANGVYVLHCTIPASPPGPYTYYLQAIIGMPLKLTNLCTMDVE